MRSGLWRFGSLVGTAGIGMLTRDCEVMWKVRVRYVRRLCAAEVDYIEETMLFLQDQEHAAFIDISIRVVIGRDQRKNR
jgi:hypothetical protein